VTTGAGVGGVGEARARVGAMGTGAVAIGGETAAGDAATGPVRVAGGDPAFNGATERAVRAAPAVVRDSVDLAAEPVTAGGRTGVDCGLVGVGAAGWSAGRVTVPFRLKFLSSLGPIVSAAGVLVVGADAGALWASAAAGGSHMAPASNTTIPRKIALIRSRS
jgi:hypothetical protein